MVSSTDRPPIDDPQTYVVIGAGFEVHRELGSGFSEPIYGEAFTLELRRRNVPFERECALPVYYQGDVRSLHYGADFVCYGEVIVEIKAISAIGPREYIQLRNYLRVARRKRGVLLNFGADSLEYRRVELAKIQQLGPADVKNNGR